MFLVLSDLKKGGLTSPLLVYFVLEYARYGHLDELLELHFRNERRQQPCISDIKYFYLI